MPTAYDPNAPLLDPDIQAALEQGRQAQLAALLGQQQQSAVPHNMGEGIDALGKGLMQGIHNYMAAKAGATNNAAMAAALSGAQPMPFMGGPSSMVPMAIAPATGPPIAGAGPTADTSSLSPVQQQVAGTLQKAGLNNNAIAGIMGNIQQESTWNPQQIGDSGTSLGLYQHHGDRKAGLLASGDLSPAGETNYALGELGGPAAPKLSIEALNAARSPQQAADLWVNGFERPNPKYANYSGREANAAKFASLLGASQAPPAPSPDQIAANIGPASHAVAPGQVAGPGLPTDLGTVGSTQKPPWAHAVAEQPPVANDEEDTQSQPAPPVPQQTATGLLSPTPLGPSQKIQPPGGIPQVAAGAVPPTPVAQPPVAPPPSVAAGGTQQQGAAPPGTHWAHLPGPPLLLAGDEGSGPSPQQGGGGLLAQLFGGGQAQAAPIRASGPPPQSMAAGLTPQAGVQVSQSQGGGLAAGLGGQQGAPPPQQPGAQAGALSALSGNQAVYQQMYQAAAGPAARLQHAAALAAASGNTALAQEYERQAAPYVAEVNKANELAVAERTEKPQLFTRNDGSSYLGDPRTGQPIAQISPAKPVDRPLTDQEAAAYGIKDKAGYAINPSTGKPEQIAGTEASATPPTDEDIKNYPFLGAPENKGLFAMDKNSKPTYVGPPEAVLNARQKTASETLTGADGKPIDPNLRGPEVLGQLPPQVANKAQAYLEAREPYPTGMQLRDPNTKSALMAAEQADPDFNAQTYHTRQQMQTSAMSGNGKINVANLANNTALNHSSVVADALAQLDNGQNPIKNAAVNEGSGLGGGIIPGATAKAAAYANAKVAKDALANEAERSFHGTGSTAEAAVKRAIDNIDLNAAPETQMAQMQSLQNLLAGKVQANEEDYKETMGPHVISSWEQQHGRPFSFVTPEAQAAADKVSTMAANIKAGKGWGVSPTPVAAPPTAAPNAPTPAGPVGASMAPRNVAPQVTGAPQAASPPKAPAFNYDAIPKGQIYTGPDGKQRRKS